MIRECLICHEEKEVTPACYSLALRGWICPGCSECSPGEWDDKTEPNYEPQWVRLVESAEK